MVDVWDLIELTVDESLPPGVIKLQGSDGNRWRYPLVEFCDWESPSQQGTSRT